MRLNNNKASFKEITSSEDTAPKPFAEIIESSLDHATAQAWEWNNSPRFGSLMQIVQQDIIILGIVTQVSTGSMDPSRYPFPYQKTEEELLCEQPQIFEFLKTTFKLQTVGFYQKDVERVFYMIPAVPPKIHSFVAQAPLRLIKHFFLKPDFAHLLFAFQENLPNLDELLLALLKELSDNKLLTPSFLEEFYQTFSLLSGNDYRRLKLFLRRIEKGIL